MVAGSSDIPGSVNLELAERAERAERAASGLWRVLRRVGNLKKRYFRRDQETHREDARAYARTDIEVAPVFDNVADRVLFSERRRNH